MESETLRASPFFSKQNPLASKEEVPYKDPQALRCLAEISVDSSLRYEFLAWWSLVHFHNVCCCCCCC